VKRRLAVAGVIPWCRARRATSRSVTQMRGYVQQYAGQLWQS